MRPPSVKRQTDPTSGFSLFAAFPVLAPSAVGSVGCLAFHVQGPPPCGRTTPVWRFRRLLGDDGRAPLGRCSATEKSWCPLFPSYAKAWRSLFCWSVRVRRGGGAAHVTTARRSPLVQEPARGSHQRPRAPGDKAQACLGIHRRSQTRLQAGSIAADPEGVP